MLCPCCGQKLPLEPDMVSRREVVSDLARRGTPATERQMRYWAQCGRIPEPVVRQRPGGASPEALYTPTDVETIRRYAGDQRARVLSRMEG